MSIMIKIATTLILFDLMSLFCSTSSNMEMSGLSNLGILSSRGELNIMYKDNRMFSFLKLSS